MLWDVVNRYETNSFVNLAVREVDKEKSQTL